jgi:DNA-binding IclR family transcriptional regulator
MVAEHYIIQTVSRALDLLEQFQEGNAELGITDLSHLLNLQKNNVFRLVATLKAKQYIEINDMNGKYRLGVKTRSLGQVAARLNNVANQTRPYLEEIKQKSHEAAYYSVLKDGCSCYLDGVESELPVRVSQRIGSYRPLHCTAAGKLLLAFTEPSSQIDPWTQLDLKRFTAATTTDPVLLRRELETIQLHGYAISDQEHDVGVVEIAAPVFDAHGALVGAISIVGPEMRLTPQRLDAELIPLVC